MKHSKTRNPVRLCKGRKRFPNSKAAKAILTSLLGKQPKDTFKPKSILKAYHCRFCGGYHLKHTKETYEKP